MLDKINLFLIIIATAVILVILYDLYTDFNEFKKEYEEDQEEKDTKLQGLFKKIGDNDKVLNNKQNEFGTSLTTQEASILENRGLINSVSQTLNSGEIETYEDLKADELKNMADKVKIDLKAVEKKRLEDKTNKELKKQKQDEERQITSKKIILNIDTPKDLEVCYKNPDDSANRICRKVILESEPSFIKNTAGFTLQRDNEDDSGTAQFLNKNLEEPQQVTFHYKD